MSTFNREELVQTLFEESADGVFLFDPDSERLVDVNPAVVRLSGFRRQEFLGRPVSHFLRSEMPDGLQALRQGFRKTGAFTSQEGFLLRTTREGVWIPLNLSITRLHVRPRPLGLITARDVREQREAYAQLQRVEAELRRVVASVSDGLWSIELDREGRVRNRYTSPVVEKLIGRPPEFYDRWPASWLSTVHAEDRPAFEEALRSLQEGRITSGESTHRVVWPDGTVRWLRQSLRATVEADGLRLDGVVTDVTDQHNLEGQLRQAQKMEAVGQLAGGVAHDFNNWLTIILGNLDLLKQSLPAHAAEQELVADTETAAVRAAELTAKMLGFARRTALQLKPVNLDRVVEETAALLRRTIDPRIRLEVWSAPELARAQADPSQVHQLLLNLCLNARDAMSQGGVLRLETDNVVLDDESVRGQIEARAGAFVRLRVQDTGSGIAPAVLPRIFEPFFTTKEPGKGTGLGLAMVFGIVKQHQGWIECHSRVGEGTRFDIYLPRAAPRPSAAVESSPARGHGTARHGHETILLVDDEPMIRQLGQTILESYGYQILLAEDGQQAVEVFGREPRGIDLVLLDLTMPRLSGADAFRLLRELDPEIRVLFASGYSADQAFRPLEEPGTGFVGKPYRPNELAQAVRTALDRPRGAGAGEEPLARREKPRGLSTADAVGLVEPPAWTG